MTDVRPARVGLIGCGNVSQHYVAGCASLAAVELVACTDADPARAAALAAAAGLRALPLDDLLADPSIDVVVNLTPPVRHTEVSLAAIAAGKHVYSEKPLATTLADAKAIVDAAARARRPARLCPGHVPRRRPPDGPRRARRGVDRGAARRATPPCSTSGRSDGTRTRTSSSPAAAARCWTSGRTTSPRSSTCSARSRRSRRSARGHGAERVIATRAAGRAPGSRPRCRRTSSAATGSCPASSPRSSPRSTSSRAPRRTSRSTGPMARWAWATRTRSRARSRSGGWTTRRGGTSRSAPTAGRDAGIGLADMIEAIAGDRAAPRVRRRSRTTSSTCCWPPRPRPRAARTRSPPRRSGPASLPSGTPALSA